MSLAGEAKAELRRKRRDEVRERRRDRWERRRRHWRCFWTRPLDHEYEYDVGGWWYCVGCGKRTRFDAAE